MALATATMEMGLVRDTGELVDVQLGLVGSLGVSLWPVEVDGTVGTWTPQTDDPVLLATVGAAVILLGVVTPS